MKKYLPYLLWFVPAIFFFVFYILSSLLALMLAHVVDNDWLLSFPLFIGPLGLLLSYSICVPYVKKHNTLSENFKSSYVVVSFIIFGLVFLGSGILGFYLIAHDATPQPGMGG